MGKGGGGSKAPAKPDPIEMPEKKPEAGNLRRPDVPPTYDATSAPLLSEEEKRQQGLLG